MKILDTAFSLTMIAMLLWMIFGNPTIGIVLALFFVVLLKIDINLIRLLREEWR